VDHDQLIDLTRRAVKLARDDTTDLAPSEHVVSAAAYTSAERHERDRAVVLASRQLVGYASELPKPGSYCTKTVMDRSILPTRTKDGTVKAFENVCLHRQSRIAKGCGTGGRLSCPYHAWTYDLDGNLVGVPGREGFSRSRIESARLAELPAAELAGFLWVSLDPAADLDVASHLGPRPTSSSSGGSDDGRRSVRRFWTARSTGSSHSTPSPRTTTSQRFTRTPSQRSPGATARCSTRSARTTD
jgi:phenylpropionate dioxygenase-like ring-hydroxylating dioxygenase large terminal subunit